MASLAVDGPPSQEAYSCACCLAYEFDPVPGLRIRSTRRPCRSSTTSSILTCEPCSATSGTEEGPTEPRNVIADGQKRFEIGEKAREQPDWESLSDRVICVLGQNPSAYTLNGTNCYLVGTGPKRLLVDAAEEPFGSEEFMSALSSCMAEHDIEGLDGILITHNHHDHYGNVWRLQEKYGPVPVYARRAAASFLLSGIMERSLMPHFIDDNGNAKYNPKKDLGPAYLPDDVDMEWAAGAVQAFMGSTLTQRVCHAFFFQWSGYKFQQSLLEGKFPVRELQDGLRVNTDGATLVAMHTPGHAEEHFSFVLEEEHAIFSGDHVLGWGTTLVWDMRDYMSSLKRMLSLRPTRLYPGHGCHIEDGVDLLIRYIEHRELRECQAWEALQRKSRPVPIREIVEELYPNTTQDRLWMACDNVERLFRKFAADGSAAAWSISEDASGTETLVPYTVPSGYSVRRLEEGLVWAAKRSMTTLGRAGLQSKI